MTASSRLASEKSPLRANTLTARNKKREKSMSEACSGLCVNKTQKPKNVENLNNKVCVCVSGGGYRQA